MDKVVDFINVNRDRYITEMKQYLAIPSISALPEHKGDVPDHVLTVFEPEEEEVVAKAVEAAADKVLELLSGRR